MNIYTVIVTHNALRKNYIHNCLRSLAESSLQTEIIVIDNASSDETCKFIENNYPYVTLIKSVENLGFGKGNNLGITEALRRHADYIFLLNQDTIVKENTIELLLKAAMQNKEFAILSPIHLNYEGSELEHYFAEFMKICNTPSFYCDHIMQRQKELYETKFVNAAAWFMPRSIFLEIGGFDPIFEHYGEDNNYCQRLLYHQFKIGVVSNSYIFHDSRKRLLPVSYKFSKQYYADFVKILQIKYANLNIEIGDFYRSERNTLLFSIITNVLSFNRKEIVANIIKLKLLNKTLPAIRESRKINSVIRSNYLDIK